MILKIYFNVKKRKNKNVLEKMDPLPFLKHQPEQSTIIYCPVLQFHNITKSIPWTDWICLCWLWVVENCSRPAQLLWELDALSSHSLPFPMDYIPDVSHEGQERKRKLGNSVGPLHPEVQ